MLDLLAATAALLVIVGVLALAGLGLTVVPFVVAGERPEARRVSTTRAGAATLVCIGAGLLGAFLVYRSALPVVVAALPLALCWLVPAVLALVDPLRLPFAGRAGRHE